MFTVAWVGRELDESLIDVEYTLNMEMSIREAQGLIVERRVFLPAVSPECEHFHGKNWWFEGRGTIDWTVSQPLMGQSI